MKTPAGSEAERAREYALLLLSYRERTEKEMAERLKRKGFPPEAVAATVADCQRLGLVDDERFARLFVQERARLNPRSARLIGAELGKRGVSGEVAARALSAEFVPGREEEMAADLARRASLRLRGVDPAAARRRLWAYLARRGFSPDQIAAAVKAVAEEKQPM